MSRIEQVLSEIGDRPTGAAYPDRAVIDYLAEALGEEAVVQAILERNSGEMSPESAAIWNAVGVGAPDVEPRRLLEDNSPTL